jgi:hypothetical protein
MLPYPGGGAYGGYSAAPMHPTGFQHGYAAPPAYQQAGGWVHQEQYLDPAAELDRVVNSSKNMRDGNLLHSPANVPCASCSMVQQQPALTSGPSCCPCTVLFPCRSDSSPSDHHCHPFGAGRVHLSSRAV